MKGRRKAGSPLRAVPVQPPAQACGQADAGTRTNHGGAHEISRAIEPFATARHYRRSGGLLQPFAGTHSPLRRAFSRSALVEPVSAAMRIERALPSAKEQRRCCCVRLIAQPVRQQEGKRADEDRTADQDRPAGRVRLARSAVHRVIEEHDLDELDVIERADDACRDTNGREQDQIGLDRRLKRRTCPRSRTAAGYRQG